MSCAKQKRGLMVIFTHEFYPKRGGIATYIEEMAQAAWEMGYSVEVYAPRDEKLEEREFAYVVKPLAKKKTKKWLRRLTTAWAIARNRKRLQDAILYLPEHGPLEVFMYLRLLGLVRPGRLVVTLYGSEVNRLGVGRVRSLLFNSLLKIVDRIGVLSQYSKQLVLNYCPEAEDKIIVTPGAVRSGFKDAKGEVKKEGGKFVILTVARVHPRKGQKAVLEAISQLKDKENVVCRIVGPVVDKEYDRELRHYAEEQGINVEFYGEVDDGELKEIYRQADMFMMTSQQCGDSVEAFGLVYLDASASGLPILAYRSGGVEDAVPDGETGILVEPGDTEGLVSALQEFVGDEGLRRSLGEAGKQKWKDCSWADSVRATFE